MQRLMQKQSWKVANIAFVLPVGNEQKHRARRTPTSPCGGGQWGFETSKQLLDQLPRIPFPPDFHAFAAAGKRLMELHIDYEKQPEYPLEQIESPTAEVSFRVDRMKLSKDKSKLRYNDFLLLRGIPATAYDYRLGNRSALEWVIDQYRVSTDPRSGIVNDPNRPDDPKYILRLIGQVITVSLETQRVVGGFPSLKFE